MTKALCLELKMAGIYTEELCKFCTLPSCKDRRLKPMMKKITPRNKRFYEVIDV